MSVKETVVRTVAIGEYGTAKMVVSYSDELLETIPQELSSTPIGSLPYLSVGYFYDGKIEDGKWYFSNARLHSELGKIINEDGKMNHIYGQLWFNPQDLEEGKHLFNLLTISSSEDDDNMDKLLKSFKKQVDPKYIREDFVLFSQFE